jgi:hypothetical protein
MALVALTLSLGAAFLVLTGACSGGATFLNPAFLNTIAGGQVPVTPGPSAAFVLVRVLNETDQLVEFIVTIEREVLVVDENGNFQVDDDGNFVTRPQRRTVQLTTNPAGLATDVGVLFPCGESPVTIVGLGEDLLPTDAAVFVGGEGAGGASGFGVPAGNLNPLRLDVGNFNCGDTVIFQAFTSTGVAGGIGLQAFLLPGAEQPSVFSGPNTFLNLEEFVQAQTQEEENGNENENDNGP